MLRGLLLNEAQKWFDQRSHDLSDQERKFISASREERERIAREEKERQERELETVQKLAHAETARAAAAEWATQAEEARALAAEKGRQEQAVAAKSLRRLAWMLAIVALVAGGAAIFGLWQKNNANKQAELAISAEKEAKKEASQANVLLALNSNAIGNDSQELAYLAKALKLDPRNYEAGALIAALLTQESWPVVTGAMKHGGWVSSAQFSADGQRVVTASWDQTARVWDAATGKTLSEPMKHDGAVWSAEFSADGQRVVTASSDKTARVWDAATGKALSEPMKHDGAVQSAEFSPDGQRVVTASNQTARVWDAATGKALGEPMKHDAMVYSAQFSPDGQRVVTRTSAPARSSHSMFLSRSIPQRSGEAASRSVRTITRRSPCASRSRL
jgi:roadblock/LC7 domain-containing protein